MRILIENYNNLYSTEPIYLLNSFKIAQCESAMWDTNVYSAYDALDSAKPDLLIVKWNCQRINDVFNYCNENSNSPDLFVNATNAPKEIIKQLKGHPKCKFVFTNDYFEAEANDINLIIPCVDVFLPTQPTPGFLLDAGICSEEKTNFGESYETYHNLQFSYKSDPDFDLTVNLYDLASLYHKYKEFILSGPLSFIFSQIFFDATARSKKVTLKHQSEDADDVRFILEKIFTFENQEDIEGQIKHQIRANHTCFNRAKDILIAAGNHSAVKIIETQIGALVDNGNNTKTI